MIDVARHFYTIPFLRDVIDALSFSKLNVLHIHLTDDQSFPLEVEGYPELTSRGAFGAGITTRYVYSRSDMQNLTEYAIQRGVILVPEIDMPAHAASWGSNNASWMTQGSNCGAVPFVHGAVLDPTDDSTYQLTDAIIRELSLSFPRSSLVSLGGDEVPYQCWASSEK